MRTTFAIESMTRAQYSNLQNDTILGSAVAARSQVSSSVWKRHSCGRYNMILNALKAEHSNNTKINAQRRLLPHAALRCGVHRRILGTAESLSEVGVIADGPAHAQPG